MREIPLLVSIYSLLFHFYPCAYQSDYHDERLSVLESALHDAAGLGRLAVWMRFVGELLALPGSIFQQHLRANRYSALQHGDNSWQAPLPWSRLVIPMVMFILLIWDRFLDGSPAATELGPVFPLLFLFLLIGILISLFTGFPRWSMPIAGLVLGGLSFYAWAAILYTSQLGDWMYFLKPPPGDVKLKLIHSFFTTGCQWSSILIILAGILLVSALLPPNRRFWRGLVQDWTLASYFIYCVTPFILIMNFDDYRFEQVYTIPALLVLAFGALLFLRTANPGFRFLVLTICLTLAMGIATAGLWNIIPLQTWPLNSQPASLIDERLLQTFQEVYNWFWILLMMLLGSLPGLFVKPPLILEDLDFTG